MDDIDSIIASDRLCDELGLDTISTAKVIKVGERINNIARAFSVREGFGRAADTFPERLMTEPLRNGASKGHLISKEDLKIMFDAYYNVRGWDIK